MSKQYQNQKKAWKEQGRQQAFKEVLEEIDKVILFEDKELTCFNKEEFEKFKQKIKEKIAK